MSEYDKRAEVLWREAWAAWEAVWDQENEDVSSDEAACAVIAAALAQARREGCEAAVIDAEAFVQHCREEGETDLRDILYHLRGIAARLLAKEEGHE